MNAELKKKMIDIVPYVPGEQPQEKELIKLNTNECPYAPSPKVSEAIADFDANRLNLYPDFNCNELRRLLGKKYGVKGEQVFLGNGSDEVLAFCFKAFFNSQKPVLFPDITYSFYNVWAELFKIPYKTIPLKNDFTIDVEGFFEENGGVVIPNPNAPTAIYEKKENIERIIEKNRDSVVIIDEAYVDFCDEGSVSRLIDKYDNLVVVQTFSKSRALAGARLGYAFANKELIGILEAVKNSFNSYTIDTLAKAAGTAAIKDNDYFNECVGKIKSTRAYLTNELNRLGFTTLPSSANFVFTTKEGCDCCGLFEYLSSKKIYVRHFNGERIKNYLRITVGTDEQVKALICAVEDYLANERQIRQH